MSSLLPLLAWIQLLSFSHFTRNPFLFDTQQHRVVKCGRHTGDKGAWNPSWPASFPLLWLQQPSLSARPLGGIHRSHLATKMDPFIYTETWSGLIPGPLCWTPALSLSWEASLSQVDQGVFHSRQVQEQVEQVVPSMTLHRALLPRLLTPNSLSTSDHFTLWCLRLTSVFLSDFFLRGSQQIPSTDTVRTTWKMTRLLAVFSNFLDFWD